MCRKESRPQSHTQVREAGATPSVGNPGICIGPISLSMAHKKYVMEENHLEKREYISQYDTRKMKKMNTGTDRENLLGNQRDA